MCVLGGGGGGGGITHPFLLSTDRQEKIMWPCGPCRLMPGQERSIHHHQDIGVGRCFDLGGGGGGGAKFYTGLGA